MSHQAASTEYFGTYIGQRDHVAWYAAEPGNHIQGYRLQNFIWETDKAFQQPCLFHSFFIPYELQLICAYM